MTGLPDPDLVRARLDRVRDRIAGAGGDPDRVAIVAVTKAFGPDAIEVAHAAGLSIVGESYVQEYVAKVDEVDPAARAGLEWHFIGRLQRNKVRQLPDDVAVVQSLDRRSLADELARRRPGQAVMLQVNIGDEPQKGGCAVGETAALVEHAVAIGLDVVGLMGVAELAAPDVVRGQFAVLARLADELQLEHRSMGMTDDLDEAVRAGSTMVRVGSALFGPRPPR